MKRIGYARTTIIEEDLKINQPLSNRLVVMIFSKRHLILKRKEISVLDASRKTSFCWGYTYCL